MPKRLAIYSNSGLFIEGIKQLINENEFNVQVVNERLDLLNKRKSYDLLIIDENRYSCFGFSRYSTTPLLCVRNPENSGFIDMDIIKGGVTYKDDLKEIKKTISLCLNGEKHHSNNFLALSQENNIKITRRQRQVIYYIKQGMLNKEIAFHLELCEHTIKKHVSSIFKKFNVNSRIELINLMG